MTTDEMEIRKLVEDWASAVRRKDLPAILRNHASTILMFDVPPPFQSKGIEAYKQTWDTFFAWSHEPVVFNIKQMSVTAGADVAFATAEMRCAGTEKNGEDIELDFRLTLGLRKVDGGISMMTSIGSYIASKRPPGIGKGRPRLGRCAQAALGGRRARKARRFARHLLPAPRQRSDLDAHDLRQERARRYTGTHSEGDERGD